MRIDFHVHSKHSKRPSQWFLQKIGCPESFTEPMQIHTIAKKRGMDFVTISDHNTIDGALEIAHLDDTFISEEITSYFPEDRCKIHILAININEKQHRDIQRVRQNVFELVAYLNTERILHVLAHPLYSLNNRLTPAHVEMMLVLFQNFEINGARSERLNEVLTRIIADLQPEDIDRWAVKHNITPMFPKPWKKNLIGGSDDHSSLNIARIFTEMDPCESLADALAGIAKGRARAVGRFSTPQTMAHNLYGIAYQFYRNKFNLSRYAGKDALLRFLDRLLVNDIREDTGLLCKFSFLWHYRNPVVGRSGDSDNLIHLIDREARKLISNTPWIREVAKNGNGRFNNLEKRWYDSVNQISNKILVHFADHLVNHLSGANVFNIFHTIGSAGGLYTLLAPYFLAYSMFSKDIRFSDAILERFHAKAPLDSRMDSGFRLARFTDSSDNGDAMLPPVYRHHPLNGHNLQAITCSSDPDAAQTAGRNFAPIGVCTLDLESGRKIEYPPFLDILDYCYKQEFTHIHLTTPGPIGLTGLIVARILKLPISGTYQEIHRGFAEFLSEDEFTEDLVWKYMHWFYSQMEDIYVASDAVKAELTHRGIESEKIHISPVEPTHRYAVRSGRQSVQMEVDVAPQRILSGKYG